MGHSENVGETKKNVFFEESIKGDSLLNLVVIEDFHVVTQRFQKSVVFWSEGGYPQVLSQA